jgi:hypothetical protein
MLIDFNLALFLGATVSLASYLLGWWVGWRSGWEEAMEKVTLEEVWGDHPNLPKS